MAYGRISVPWLAPTLPVFTFEQPTIRCIERCSFPIVLYSTDFLRLEVFNCVVWEEGEEAWRWSKELLLIYNCPSYWHCDGAECLVLTNCCCVKVGIEIVIFSGSFKPSHSPHCCTPRTSTHSRCNVNIYAICKNLVQRMANFGVDGCCMRWFPRRRGLVLENWQIVCNFIFSLVTAVGAGRRERGRQPHRVAEELHPRQPSHHQHILTIHLKWTLMLLCWVLTWIGQWRLNIAKDLYIWHILPVD